MAHYSCGRVAEAANGLDSVKEAKSASPMDEVKLKHNRALSAFVAGGMAGAPRLLQDLASADADLLKLLKAKGEGPEERERAWLRYNQAVILFTHRHHAGATVLLEQIFHHVDDVDEWVAMRAGFLLLDVYSQAFACGSTGDSNLQPVLDTAQRIIRYLEGHHYFNDIGATHAFALHAYQRHHAALSKAPLTAADKAAASVWARRVASQATAWFWFHLHLIKARFAAVTHGPKEAAKHLTTAVLSYQANSMLGDVEHSAELVAPSFGVSRSGPEQGSTTRPAVKVVPDGAGPAATPLDAAALEAMATSVPLGDLVAGTGVEARSAALRELAERRSQRDAEQQQQQQQQQQQGQDAAGPAAAGRPSKPAEGARANDLSVVGVVVLPAACAQPSALPANQRCAWMLERARVELLQRNTGRATGLVEAATALAGALTDELKEQASEARVGATASASAGSGGGSGGGEEAVGAGCSDAPPHGSLHSPFTHCVASEATRLNNLAVVHATNGRLHSSAALLNRALALCKEEEYSTGASVGKASSFVSVRTDGNPAVALPGDAREAELAGAAVPVGANATLGQGYGMPPRPPRPEVCLNLGLVALRSRQPLRAFILLKRASSLYRQRPRLWLRLGEACVMHHDMVASASQGGADMARPFPGRAAAGGASATPPDAAAGNQAEQSGLTAQCTVQPSTGADEDPCWSTTGFVDRFEGSGTSRRLRLTAPDANPGRDLPRGDRRAPCSAAERDPSLGDPATWPSRPTLSFAKVCFTNALSLSPYPRALRQHIDQLVAAAKSNGAVSKEEAGATGGPAAGSAAASGQAATSASAPASAEGASAQQPGSAGGGGAAGSGAAEAGSGSASMAELRGRLERAEAAAAASARFRSSVLCKLAYVYLLLGDPASSLRYSAAVEGTIRNSAGPSGGPPAAALAGPWLFLARLYAGEALACIGHVDSAKVNLEAAVVEARGVVAQSLAAVGGAAATAAAGELAHGRVQVGIPPPEANAACDTNLAITHLLLGNEQMAQELATRALQAAPRMVEVRALQTYLWLRGGATPAAVSLLLSGSGSASQQR